MDLLQSITLGLIQGTTEWLPVSSTGHLRIAEHFFNLRVPLLFDVILHVGTLLVILIYFRNAAKNVVLALWHRDFQCEDGKLILPIIVGTIPTVLIGVLVGNEFDSFFSALSLLGVGFIASGLVLAPTKNTSGNRTVISLPAAIFIGFMQGLSIIPSISRSGFTIGVALLLGIKKEIAFKYSFLLSIPAIAGALSFTLYQEYSIFSVSGIEPFYVIISLAITVLVSFFALNILWKTIAAKKFYLFAIYCFFVGLFMIALGVLGF